MLGEYTWGRRRMRKLGNWDTECLATGPRLARLLLSDLSLEIILHDAQVFLLECWDCLAHDRVDFGYELIDVRRGDGLTRVKTRAVTTHCQSWTRVISAVAATSMSQFNG